MTFHEGFRTDSRASDRIVPICYPRPGRPVEGVLLDSTVLSHDVHFDRTLGKAGRTVPCLGPTACAYCLAGLGSNVKYFLAAAFPDSLGTFVLQVSDGGGEDLKLIVALKPDWRGLHLIATRADKRKVARMNVESKGRWEGGPLPKTFDVRPVLHRLWGLSPGAATIPITRTPRPTRASNQGRN